jgi:flagellar hook-basal body complex protein FliE
MRVPMGGVGAVVGAGEVAGFGAVGGGGGGFAEALDAAVRAVDSRQVQADEQLRGLATGENVDIHGTMIALEEANIALRTMGSVRDKVVEAYQTIWNMPV